MAYYLTIANKGEYKKLNLLLLEGFIKTSKFKGEALSLDELDDLTSKYQDEYEFKKKLYQAGIISIDEITKELSIRRKQNNNLIKVKYGLIYQKESKYLDQLYLRSILISKQRDYTFLEKLSSYYRNSYNNSINIANLSLIAKHHYDFENSKILSDFFQREIYKYNPSTDECKLNYKSLHDLAMFVYNYNAAKAYRSLGITKDMLDKERQEKLSLLKENLIKENQKLKKQLEVGEEQYNDLVEEKESLQEQLSSNLLQLEIQQKDFIKYLEKEIVDCKAGSGQQYYAQEHLKMFKEIIGGNKDEW